MTHSEMMKMTPQQLTELGHIERSKAFRRAFRMITSKSSSRKLQNAEKS